MTQRWQASLDHFLLKIIGETFGFLDTVKTVLKVLGAISANCQLARQFAKDYSVTDTDITWGGNAGDDSTQGTGISDDGATGENR